MIDFGNTLRQAREAKGYTISQLAERTRLSVQAIEALETENFSTIAAPIYGRGFVRLYCEAVGIDDYQTLVREFTELYSGERAPTIRERTRGPQRSLSATEPSPATRMADPPPSRQAPEPENSLFPTDEAQPDLFSEETQQTTVPDEVAAPLSETRTRDDTAADAANECPVTYPRDSGRYAPPPAAADWVQKRHNRSYIPQIPLRLIAVVAFAVLLLLGVIFGIRSLVGFLSSPSASEAASADAIPDDVLPSGDDRHTEVGTTEYAAPKNDLAPVKPRVPQKIPALYID